MVAVLGFGREQIHEAVREMYTLVARRPTAPLHFPVGPDACRLAGYDEGALARVPAAALESFAGVGCPFRAEVIEPGQTVLDVGSGSGTDVSIAARTVGPGGRVYALDLTAAMREKLAATLAAAGIDNVRLLEGDAERIPLPDASVDVVTTNGVLNLVPDKRRAIDEIFRVLRPGGRVQLADIVIARPVTPDCEDDPTLWAECVVGATVDERLLEMFGDAGFEDIEVLRDYDYFAASPSEETREVAHQFGAHAYELRMRRGEVAPSPAVRWAWRLDPRRAVRDVRRRGLGGLVALGAALLACYGTLALVALLSLLGVTLAIDEGAWAATIVVAAAVTALVVASGRRVHGALWPTMPALGGAALVAWSMLVDYSLLVELGGFALLVVASVADYRLRRWAPVTASRRRPRERVAARAFETARDDAEGGTERGAETLPGTGRETVTDEGRARRREVRTRPRSVSDA